MKEVLKDKLGAREIGGPGFVQENLILSNLHEIITHKKVTTNQSTGEKERQVLHLVEDKFSSEDNILIVLRGKRKLVTAVQLEKPKHFSIGYDTGTNHMIQNDPIITEAKNDGWFAPW